MAQIHKNLGSSPGKAGEQSALPELGPYTSMEIVQVGLILAKFTSKSGCMTRTNSRNMGIEKQVGFHQSKAREYWHGAGRRSSGKNHHTNQGVNYAPRART